MSYNHASIHQNLAPDPRNPPPFSWQPAQLPIQPGGVFFFEIPDSFVPVLQAPQQYLQYPAVFPAPQAPQSTSQQQPQQGGFQRGNMRPGQAQNQLAPIPPELLQYLNQQGYTIVPNQKQHVHPTQSSSGVAAPQPKPQVTAQSNKPPPSLPDPPPWTPQQHFLNMLRQGNKQPANAPVPPSQLTMNLVQPSVSSATSQPSPIPTRPLPYHLRPPPLPKPKRRKRAPAAAKHTTAMTNGQSSQIAPPHRMLAPQLPVSQISSLMPASSFNDLVSSNEDMIGACEDSIMKDPVIDQLPPSCAQSLENLANALRIDSWFPRAVAVKQGQQSGQASSNKPATSSSTGLSVPSATTQAVVRPYIHGNRPLGPPLPPVPTASIPLLQLPQMPGGFVNFQPPPNSSNVLNGQRFSLPPHPLPHSLPAAAAADTSQPPPHQRRVPAAPTNRTQTEKDRRNAAQRRYYEKRKAEKGKGAVRKRLLLTEEEKRARQAARGREWRTRNYVRVLTVVKPSDAAPRLMTPIGQLNGSTEHGLIKVPVKGRGRGRPRLLLTEQEKKARQAATCRAWRARNYIKFIGQFAPAAGGSSDNERPPPMSLLNIKTEPADEEAMAVNQQIRRGILIRRNIKREPAECVDEMQETIDEETTIQDDSYQVAPTTEPSQEMTMPTVHEAIEQDEASEQEPVEQLDSISSDVEEDAITQEESIEPPRHRSRTSSAFSDEM